MAVVVAGVMAAATVIELGDLLRHYWSRPNTAGSVFQVTVVRGARLEQARTSVAWRRPNNPVALVI